MPVYATIDEAREYGYQSTDDDEDVLASILTRASRLFDRYCGVKAGYFGKGDPNQTASARRYWGNGTDYLQIDPYLSSPTIIVTMPDGWDVPPFIESRDQGFQSDDGQGFQLIRTYADNSRYGFISGGFVDDYAGALFAANVNYVGWPNGVRVTVEAKWGWDAVLDDVREAVLETTIAIWRGKDQAFARVVNLGESQQVFSAMPDRAKLIADRYRMARGMFA
jgi:hypothetical protein